MVASQVQLVTCTIPANDVPRLKAFYSNVFFGDRVAKALSEHQAWHTWVSAGVKFNISQRAHHNETPMMHFAVDNLDRALDETEQHNGRVLVRSGRLPVLPQALGELKQAYEAANPDVEMGDNMGRFAVISDPEGNRVTLMQLEPWAKKMFDKGQVSEAEHDQMTKAMEIAETL